MIEIITAHEADQLIATRQPLWSTHTSCNGSCNQGRACDCTAAIPSADADDWEPLTARDHLVFWAPVLTVTVGLLAFVLHAAGVRL